MKKVLIVACNDLGNGGVQHVIMDIVRNLSDKFHFDIVLFSDKESYYEPEFKKYGRIFRIPHKGANGSFRSKLDKYIRFHRLYLGIKKILKENGPYDIIHCHNYFEAAPCLMAAKHCEVPVRISHSHSYMPRTHLAAEGMFSVYRKLINHYATHRIGCSQMAADYLFGANTGAISIPNAIDLKRFDRSLYPQQKIKHSFIHVGRLCGLKNQLFILNVFAVIQKKWPDASLKLIGKDDGNYKDILFKRIEELNLKNVKFLYHDSDIPALMAQSEYMIFPSISEGFGLVLAEAQAMGVKCFASDIVPPETNIGLCQYISLKASPEVWAQAVFDAENKPLPKPNIEKVSLLNYNNKIRSLYNQGGNNVV